MADKVDKTEKATKDAPTLQASPHTVTSASVGTTLTSGAGTITAFTMNQPSSTQVDDLTPLTLVDPLFGSVATAVTGASGSGGVNGTAVYQVGGGVGTPATVNCTWAAGVLTINSVASGGNYTTFPASPAPLTYVSGTATGWTGATATITAGVSASTTNPAPRVLYSANMRALASQYEPRPGVALTPGTTAPTWPKTIVPAGVVIPFVGGCQVASCPANMTFTVTC